MARIPALEMDLLAQDEATLVAVADSLMGIIATAVLDEEYDRDMAEAVRMDAMLAKWLTVNGYVVDEHGRQVLGFLPVTDQEVRDYVRQQEKLVEDFYPGD